MLWLVRVELVMLHIVITQIWARFYKLWIRYVSYHTCCTAASEFITFWFRRVQSDFPEKSYKVITAYHTITFLIKSSKLCLQLYRQQKLYIYQVWVFLRNLLQPKLQHKQLSSINTSTDSHNCDNPFQQFDFLVTIFATIFEMKNLFQSQLRCVRTAAYVAHNLQGEQVFWNAEALDFGQLAESSIERRCQIKY